MAIHWMMEKAVINPKTKEHEGWSTPRAIPAAMAAHVMRTAPSEWKVINKNTEVEDKLGAPLSNAQWKTDSASPESPTVPTKPPLPIEQDPNAKKK